MYKVHKWVHQVSQIQASYIMTCTVLWIPKISSTVVNILYGSSWSCLFISAHQTPIKTTVSSTIMMMIQNKQTLDKCHHPLESTPLFWRNKPSQNMFCPRRPAAFLKWSKEIKLKIKTKVPQCSVGSVINLESDFFQVIISCTRCRKHHQVLQLAKWLLMASLILFLWRCGHMFFVPDM